MIEAVLRVRKISVITALAACLALGAPLVAPASEAAAETGGHGESHGVDWQAWTAGNEIGNTASLQRGAANYVNYCLACHSLKYMRFERMAKDLDIAEAQLVANLIPNGAKPTEYMISTFPAEDAAAWFGRAPPDLSLITRSKGPDYVFRFLKGFYVDASKPSGTNNLALDGAAMPAVLSDLEGVKRAVFADAVAGHAGGKPVERFELIVPGRLNEEQYDGFVRDTVNFLDYVGEPSQVQRRDIGIWVVLFLLVFTGFAWMLKKEYWKDVH
jgi:ubiquinol-cytochrome c reductase cytochrome c1 subunit